jgi:hypothetical protein
MSILDRNDISNPVPPARMAANRLVNMTKQTYKQMVQSFNNGSEVFWQNSMGATPSEIAAELGTDAREVFELHYKLGQLIATVKPEAIAQGAALVGNFTMNEDGTVTVIVPEPEVVEPEVEPEAESTTTPEPQPE